MTPQELKNSILQLAIQGRLVEQRPEEGTAEELYRQIQREKAALVKAGKIKKEKPLPEITEEEVPFEIPEGWKWVRHNDLFEVVGGGQPPKSKFIDAPKEGYIRLYQIRDYGEKPVPVYIPMELATKVSRKGDILLARYGGSLGKVFWAEDGAYNVAMAKVVYLFSENKIDSNYLFYYYLAPIYQTLVKGNTRSAQAGFNKEDLNSLLFPFPPLAEQKRIVAKIEELLPYIDRYEAAWSRLEDFNKRFPTDMQKSILQLAIQGKLVPQRPEEGTGEALYQRIQAEKQSLIRSGQLKKEKPLPEITSDEIPFDIPESWKWVFVGNTCTNIQYGTSQKSEKTGKMIVLRMGNLQNGRIIYDKLAYSSDERDMEQYLLEYNDLLFNRTNSKELVGKTAIYKGEYPAIYAGYLVRITPVILDSDYLNYVMQSKYYWSYCQTVRSDAIGQSNINAEKLKRFLFPLPPLAEQKRIVAKLEELTPLCERLV